MPITKEFIVLLEDRPSMLGRVCLALADREVNILALQSFTIGGKMVTRFILDNPQVAKTVLNSQQLTFVEAEIVLAKIQHRPGEIARLASRLGEADINTTTLIAVWSLRRTHLWFSSASRMSARRLGFLSRPEPRLRSLKVPRGPRKTKRDAARIRSANSPSLWYV